MSDLKKHAGKSSEQHQEGSDHTKEGNPQGLFNRINPAEQVGNINKLSQGHDNTNLTPVKISDIVSHTKDNGFNYYAHRDGSNETVFPNGESVRKYKDGSSESHKLDGTSSTTDGKGGSVNYNAEGKPTFVQYPNNTSAEITYGKDGNPNKIETWSGDKGHEIRERTHCHLGNPWKAEWQVTKEDLQGKKEKYTCQSAAFVDKNDGEIQLYDRHKDGSWTHDRHTPDGKSTHSNKDIPAGSVLKWSYEKDHSTYVVNEHEKPIYDVTGQSIDKPKHNSHEK